MTCVSMGLQAIEAIDRHHYCTEYWRSHPQPPTAVSSSTSTRDHQLGSSTENGVPAGAAMVIRGLLEKGSPEELQALRGLLSSDNPSGKKELIDILEEVIERTLR